MSSFTVLFFVAQACLIQAVFGCGGIETTQIISPCGGAISNAGGIGLGAGLGYGLGYGAGYGLGLASTWGGIGTGNVGVDGTLDVAGNTLVAGQIPVLGQVGFGGTVPAAGAVTISGSCGYPCGCNSAYGGNYY